MRSPRPALARVVGVVGGAFAALGVFAEPVAAHGPPPVDPPTPASLALDWTFEPSVAIPIALLAIGWVVMVDRIDRHHPGSPVPLKRTVFFMAGLASIAIALMSGIARYDTALFSIHMVQHLLLMLVAAPLLALSAPVTQVLRVASPRVRRRVLLPILDSAVVKALGHPVVAWLSFTLVLYLSHFSPLFEAALEDPFIHDLEHVLFLAAALLFWWPIVALDPAPRRLSHPARIGYVLVQMPPSSFLAMVVLFANSALYSHYAALGSIYGIDPLADQQLAAGIMWFVSDAILIGTIMLLVAGWMRHEERDQVAADRRTAAAKAAIDERAERLARRTGRGPVGPYG
ncbi:MAG TPA: cytochrome c oxidase assembly protein [Candidatus Limnocylindrales bacterium]|nr:cytochrome c oxidase assembly protein [Candidatus Limnocylindrales bacterium]